VPDSTSVTLAWVSAQPSVVIGDAIATCAHLFAEAGLVFGHGTDNAWDEATWLVLHVTGAADQEDSLGLSVDGVALAHLVDLAQRRIVSRQPLAYLLGQAKFAGLDFYCEPGVIVPRSPLAELLLAQVQPWLVREPRQILDMCCGTGCIGIAAALSFPGSQVLLVDVDAQAIALANANVARYQLQDRVTVLQSDLFSQVSHRQSWDLVLCNPPYVDAADMSALPAEFVAEPALALAGGADGLSVMAPFLQQCRTRLNPGGVFVGEVGNSAPALLARFPQWPFIWPDLANGGEGVFVLQAQDWVTDSG